MIPKAVIFDLGKVLLDFDFSLAAKRLQPHCRVTTEQLRMFIDQSTLLFRFETGQIDAGQFFVEVQSLSGYEGSFEDFSRIFADIFSPIDPMIELQGQLTSHGIPTFVFSNTNDLAITHVRADYPFYSRFQGYVLSYEHGVMKPDPRLYEEVETMTGLSGPDLFYIDDRPENIETALQRQWQAVVHQDATATIRALRETGLMNWAPESQTP
jgi:HAD superfamily hydrolase (TIGR01509 family)